MQGLPNDIIMNIIQLADGGRFEHKKKMRKIFSQITNNEPIYRYEDGCGEMCPYFWYEEVSHIRNQAPFHPRYYDPVTRLPNWGWNERFENREKLWSCLYRRGRDIPTDEEDYDPHSEDEYVNNYSTDDD